MQSSSTDRYGWPIISVSEAASAETRARRVRQEEAEARKDQAEFVRKRVQDASEAFRRFNVAGPFRSFV